MEKRDLKADLEQLKRTKKAFEPQQVTFETPEDEIVPEIDILDQQIYALFGLGEFTAKYGEEWLERAIEAEALARELADTMKDLLPRYLTGRLNLDFVDLVYKAKRLISKAEVLGMSERDLEK